MNKLELLAPYLPYGLRVQFDGCTHRLIGINSVESDPWITLHRTEDSYRRIGTPDDATPCFRPFSQIDKPTPLNGRMIVPAVEIAKLAVGDDDWRVTFKNKYVVGITSGQQRMHFDCNWNIEVSDTDKKFALNTYKIFQLLHRLHFAPPGLDESEYIAIREGV